MHISFRRLLPAFLLIPFCISCQIPPAVQAERFEIEFDELLDAGDIAGARQLQTQLEESLIDGDSPEALAQWPLKRSLLLKYFDLDDEQRGMALADSAARHVNILFGPNSREFLAMESMRGSYLMSLGELQDALAVLEPVTRALEERYGIYGEEVLDAKAELAIALNKLGQTKRSEALHLEVIERTQVVHGHDDKHTAIAMNNYAVMLFGVDRLEEAEQFFEESLSIRQSIFGPVHPRVLTGIVNLSSIRSALGNNEGALQLLKESVELTEATLGKNAPLTLSARSFYIIEDFTLTLAEQVEQLSKVLAEQEKIFPSGHPTVLLTMLNVATIEWSRGNYKASAMLAERCALLCGKTYGSNHEMTLDAKQLAADAWQAKAQEAKDA